MPVCFCLQAKAQLEATFTLMLEEKDEKITVMQTQVLYANTHAAAVLDVTVINGTNFSEY